MRPPTRNGLALAACALFAGCAMPTRVVSPADDSEITFEQLADELLEADVVVLGEQHATPAVHEAHLRIVRALHERHDDLVISLEMFERDVQTVLFQYLLGDIDEDEFLAASRPWPNYARDYRPLVEFAREHGLMVIAANAPRPLAQRVAKEGDEALDELVGQTMHVARQTSAPDDEYWRLFQDAMSGHGALDDDAMRRYYQAQCLKDDTMAEAIADELSALYDRGRTPIVVHVCGRMHSDFRLGTVARLKERMPDLLIRVVTCEEVPDELEGTFVSPPRIADYVLLVPEREQKPMRVAMRAEQRARPVHQKAEAEAPEPEPPGHGEAPVAREHGHGEHGAAGRPGLGFMPVYEADVDGCMVGRLIEGGAAANAGIKEGDVIVKLGEVEVYDVRSYAEALDLLEIGQRVPVKLERGDTIVHLEAIVGRSHR